MTNNNGQDAPADPQPQPVRLKKDGTPDRRGGTPGNRGNVHATGRKKIPGRETRKNLMIYASDAEWTVMQDFCRIIKNDINLAQKILDDLGTPPPENKKPPVRARRQHGIRLLESEKILAKKMILLVRDRLNMCKMAINASKNN